MDVSVKIFCLFYFNSAFILLYFRIINFNSFILIPHYKFLYGIRATNLRQCLIQMVHRVSCMPFVKGYLSDPKVRDLIL
jgi:hypothetical protein